MTDRITRHKAYKNCARILITVPTFFAGCGAMIAFGLLSSDLTFSQLIDLWGDTYFLMLFVIGVAIPFAVHIVSLFVVIKLAKKYNVSWWQYMALSEQEREALRLNWRSEKVQDLG